MAQHYTHSNPVSLPVASGVEKNEVVVVGNIAGVAITDRDAAGNALITREGVYNLAVTGAVTAGAAVYAADTAVDGVHAVSASSTDAQLLGYALEAGTNTTVKVVLGH